MSYHLIQLSNSLVQWYFVRSWHKNRSRVCFNMRSLLGFDLSRQPPSKASSKFWPRPQLQLLLAIAVPCLTKMNVILSHLILKFVVVGSGFLKLSPFYTVQGSVQGVQVFVVSVRSLCTCTIPTSTQVRPKPASVGHWLVIPTIFGLRIATVGTLQTPISCLQVCRF
jgi:hypothetical protein